MPLKRIWRIKNLISSKFLVVFLPLFFLNNSFAAPVPNSFAQLIATITANQSKQLASYVPVKKKSNLPAFAEKGLDQLVSPQVKNQNVAYANYTTMSLDDGKVDTVDFYGDNLVNFGVSEKRSERHKQIEKNPSHGIVTVKMASTVLDKSINTEGFQEATSAKSLNNGKIILLAALN